jgi:acetolactate synthase I/II/III large subunit
VIAAEIDVPHALVRVLEEAGIEFVFGMPGGDTGRIFDALYDSSSIRTILVRHEQTGSLMAEMYGRLTGKPGVVMGQGISDAPELIAACAAVPAVPAQSNR